MSDWLMSAAIVKGLIEHKDGRRFFGSLYAYSYHFDEAVERKLVTEKKRVTKRGTEWYERCLKTLPQSRQVFWKDVGEPKDLK